MKIFRASLFLILFTFSFRAAAQYTGNEKKYTLVDIQVSGQTQYSAQTVLRYAKLKAGMSIIVPGDKIRNAITELWQTGLFDKVDVYATKIQGDEITLEIALSERPKLSRVEITGVKKNKREALLKENDLKVGRHITDALLLRTRSKIRDQYRKKGYHSAKVKLTTRADTLKGAQILHIDIKRGKRIKIQYIHFTGNEHLRSRKLRAAMKDTKQKAFWHLFKASKFQVEKYRSDLQRIIEKYRQQGFRDAKILSDSVYFTADNTLGIDIQIHEGKRYYFGSIKWVGNSTYSTDLLNRVLGYQTGDPYNMVGLAYKLNGNPKKPMANNDVHSLYLNNGYLFSNAYPVETSVRGDSVNVAIHVHEGAQAYVNRVEVSGNTRTHDHVIYREIRTKPGELFSKEKLQRTVREIAQLNFFDPQKIQINPKPDPETQAVDIGIKLEEKGSSQIELQGGYGGGYFVGSLGFSFNNFSIRNLFNAKAWRPVPMGDGEALSLQLQASRRSRTYSISFAEPWLGGVKPNLLRVSLYRNKTEYLSRNPEIPSVIDEGSLRLTGLSIGLAKRLNWPDDYFVLQQSLNFDRYDIKNYYIDAFQLHTGHANNLNYELIFGRNSSGPNIIYPTSGSNFALTFKGTPPYSLLGMNAFSRYKKELDALEANPKSSPQQIKQARERYHQAQFQWLEFYKFKFKGDWYSSLAKNLVLRFNTEFGMLGAYNAKKGISPFERFYMGGSGMNGWSFDGRESIPLRGYPDPSNYGYNPLNTKNEDITPGGGGVLYDKFMLELRYPLTLNPNASVFVLGFAEAGSIADEFDHWYPFTLKRSAGFGMRIFMPAFGLLGIDFGYGFDSFIGQTKPSGWQTHFIIGRQL